MRMKRRIRRGGNRKGGRVNRMMKRVVKAEAECFAEEAV
jgi:hypothetical protein